MKIVLMQEEGVSKCFKMKRELLPRILVKDPVTHDSWEKGRFTTYLICIKTEHPAFHLRRSAVRRRFSELRWLYKILQENHSHVHFPRPPGKKVFAERFEQEFINTRMVEIQNYLNELLVTDNVLSDAAFHFFIQTDLTIEEIQEYLDGSLAESIVKEAWENAGHLHTSSYIVNSIVIPHEPQEIVMNEEDMLHSTPHSPDASSSHSGVDISGPPAAETRIDVHIPPAVNFDELKPQGVNTTSEEASSVDGSGDATVSPFSGHDDEAAATCVVTPNGGAEISASYVDPTNDDDVFEGQQ